MRIVVVAWIVAASSVFMLTAAEMAVAQNATVGEVAGGYQFMWDDKLGERFPAGSLLLTTGGASTHAWTGQWIALGPEELSRHTLAHEFSHLLGFGDAYLRGFEGKPDDRYGLVLVEWTGLQDDLMGNVRGGRVTRGMIETLLEAYGSR